MSSEVVELFSFSRISWRIENFSLVNSEAGLDSTVFSVGSSKWKARIFPKGKGGVYDQLSLFLVPVDAAILPYAEITAVVTSQTDRCYNVAKEIKYQFLETNIGNGWSEFMPLSALHDPVKGYIVQDTCVIRMDVFCRARIQ